MDITRSTVKWQFALLYLDYIFISSRFVENNLDETHKVLCLLSRDCVSLNLNTQFSFEDRKDYLNKLFLPGMLTILTKETNAIHRLHDPANLVELNWSWQHTLTVRTKLQTRILKLNCKLEKSKSSLFGRLNATKSRRWNTAKIPAVSTTIVTPENERTLHVVHPRFWQALQIVLLQEQAEGLPKFVSYWLRSLHKFGQAYDTIHFESHSVGLYCNWSLILKGLDSPYGWKRTPFEGYKRCQARKGIIGGCRLRLSDFDFEVGHRVGCPSDRFWTAYNACSIPCSYDWSR